MFSLGTSMFMANNILLWWALDSVVVYRYQP